MEYTEPLVTADIILSIFNIETRASINNSNIYREVQQVKTKTNEIISQSLLRLVKDGFLDFNKDFSNYTLTGTTASFIENGKYEGLCKKIKEDESRALIKEAKELEQIQSVINTNTSIQTLNTQTDNFYEKQKTYNNVQIGFTIAIVLATIVSATVATCDYMGSKNYDKHKCIDTVNHKQTVLQIEEKLKKLIDEDSTFRKETKDSLKNISERIKTKH